MQGKKKDERPALDQFCRDLSAEAEAGRIDPVRTFCFVPFSFSPVVCQVQQAWPSQGPPCASLGRTCTTGPALARVFAVALHLYAR